MYLASTFMWVLGALRHLVYFFNRCVLYHEPGLDFFSEPFIIWGLCEAAPPILTSTYALPILFLLPVNAVIKMKCFAFKLF